uniref:Ribonuclease H n=1 Tax=Pithovirus LCPAC403 TaxID=2506596 RepID=A0A481ZB00_9VIRU|nr:MAG: ribonuclease H [Pithovirus LCPAC403]
MYTLYFDGCSKGNPGSSGAGYSILDEDGKECSSGYEYLGDQTNNYAEYSALIIGLKEADNIFVKHLHVKGDSKLVIEQMSCRWKCRSKNLAPLYTSCINYLRKFNSVTFEHIPRNENKRADLLANMAVTMSGF